jgi:hypothetical protein
MTSMLSMHADISHPCAALSLDTILYIPAHKEGCLSIILLPDSGKKSAFGWIYATLQNVPASSFIPRAARADNFGFILLDRIFPQGVYLNELN